MIVIPGGFSAGDDRKAQKFIATVLEILTLQKLL